MDEKIILALVPAIASLLGAVIGGTVALLANRAATERELQKERLVRIHNLAFDKLAPNLFTPLVQMSRECQHQVLHTGTPPRWDYAGIQQLLETERFLVLVSPTQVRTVLQQLEQHIVHPDEDLRAQKVAEDLKRLEMVIVDTYGTYRLEGAVGER